VNLRELMVVLGHELRTPLAAILGYQELLADGIYGELNSRQKEPVERIQRSAEQILSLIDGLQELAAAGNPSDDVQTTTDTRSVIESLAQRLLPVAEARGVQLEFDQGDNQLLENFLLQRFLRAAEMAAMAAIKSSFGQTLHIDCTRSDSTVTCFVRGSRLDPQRDHPVHFTLEARDSAPTSAAQVRLAMAAATLAAAGGGVRFLPDTDGTTLELSLPLSATSD
jgi:light-regulated signal transduction histidine kinase (bacteriophytochrome)